MVRKAYGIAFARIKDANAYFQTSHVARKCRDYTTGSGRIIGAWRAKYSLYHIHGAVKMRSGPCYNNVKQETNQKLTERGGAIDIFVATQKCYKNLKREALIAFVSVT